MVLYNENSNLQPFWMPSCNNDQIIIGEQTGITCSRTKKDNIKFVEISENDVEHSSLAILGFSSNVSPILNTILDISLLANSKLSSDRHLKISMHINQ